jgi:single-stranded-DNA-specific exonuclease
LSKFKSKNWEVLPKIKKKNSEELCKFPEIVRQLLVNRNIQKKENANHFLDPDYEYFHDPYQLHGVKEAAKVIMQAVEEKKKIVIHGDFDVDGICSTSILWDFLYRVVGADVLPYIPSRFEEGYGMTDRSLRNVRKLGGELVITVDCGIKDAGLIKKWKRKGLEFVVTDHHELDKKNGRFILPFEAKAIVHPSFPEHKYPFENVSGATVVWKLIQVIAREGVLDVDIDSYLDLVALSTVCDVMPLVDENRSILKRGLRTIQDTQRVGLRRLIYDAGLEPTEIETYHLGFIIGPRLNAAGRLDLAIDAVKLLVTKSLSKARELSKKLHDLNLKRQHIQQRIYEDALAQIESNGLERKLYFAWGADWEEGVIGIVAGKISESFHRPVLIATKKKNGYTGSARSIEGFNIIEAISTQSGILDRFGGHPQAAGFSVSAEAIEQFRDNLLELADRDLSEDDLVKSEIADCRVELGQLDWELADWIERFAPFGFGNEKPVFILEKAEIAYLKTVGQTNSHLSIAFLNKSTGEYFNGIGFNLGERAGKLEQGDFVDVLFNLDVNEWNGERKLQLNIKDIRISSK